MAGFLGRGFNSRRLHQFICSIFSRGRIRRAPGSKAPICARSAPVSNMQSSRAGLGLPQHQRPAGVSLGTSASSNAVVAGFFANWAWTSTNHFESWLRGASPPADILEMNSLPKSHPAVLSTSLAGILRWPCTSPGAAVNSSSTRPAVQQGSASRGRAASLPM